MPYLLYGDQIRLKQVLINLVKNALKFTQGDAIKIVAAYDHSSELLKCQVIDNGLGFNDEEKQKIFLVFGKAERTSKANAEGVGFGLVICKKIVERSGGTISAFSAGENMGATFSFTMKMQAMKDRLPP